MTLEQIQQHLLALLNKANQAGAFTLEDSNAAILALNGLTQVINQQKAGVQTMDAENNPPIPPDPSKP